MLNLSLRSLYKYFKPSNNVIHYQNYHEYHDVINVYSTWWAHASASPQPVWLYTGGAPNQAILPNHEWGEGWFEINEYEYEITEVGDWKGMSVGESFKSRMCWYVEFGETLEPREKLKNLDTAHHNYPLATQSSNLGPQMSGQTARKSERL